MPHADPEKDSKMMTVAIVYLVLFILAALFLPKAWLGGRNPAGEKNTVPMTVAK